MKSLTYQQITSDQFDMAIEKSYHIPIIISFFTTWMGSAQMLDYIMESLSAKYDGQIHFYKCTIDRHDPLVEHFNFTTFPTTLLIDKAILVDKYVGIHSRPKLDKYLSDLPLIK